MSWSLFTENGAPVLLEGLLPPTYRGPHLVGARVQARADSAATIVVQELPVASFLLRLNHLETAGPLTLVTRWLQPLVQARIQLTGSTAARLEGMGKVLLRQSQFHLLATPPAPCTLHLEKSALVQSVDVVYPQSVLEELTPYFPQLEKRLKAFWAGRPARLTPPDTWATGAMLALVQDLLSCPYAPGLREVYLEYRIRELLLLQLEGTHKDHRPAQEFSSREVAAVYEVRRLILANLDRHYTISELARGAGLNEFTLKQVFKSVFATGPFECLLQARMERARDLLLETDLPIKAIAARTGYLHLTSFIHAFRKFFGYTPGSLRRKSGES